MMINKLSLEYGTVLNNLPEYTVEKLPTPMILFRWYVISPFAIVSIAVYITEKFGACKNTLFSEKPVANEGGLENV